MINFNLLGCVDILAALMLYFTVSPVPAAIATGHAAFLFIKGAVGFIPFKNPPAFLTPIYILGGGADIISAAILVIGTPPVLPEFDLFIAGILFVKGAWTFITFL